MLAAPPAVLKKAVLVDNLVYLGLLVLLVTEICKGPLKYLNSVETKFVSSKTEESEAKYPTVSLCKFHGFKCAKRASNCNQSSWTTLQDIRANSYLLEDFYESATLSEGYTQTGGKEYMSIPPSAWVLRPQDLEMSSLCYTLDLDEMAHKGTENSLKINLREKIENSSETGYLLTVYEKDDDLMSGINFLDDIDARTFVIAIGTVSLFHVDRKIEQRIRECETDESLSPLTTCVRSSIDRKFPQCPGLISGGDQDCPIEVIRGRMALLTEYRLAGYSALTHKLSCRIPCRRVVYKVWHDFTLHDMEKLLRERRTTIELLLYYSPEIEVLTEKYIYTLVTFLSDLGGLSGLTLGLSAWGGYSLVRKAVDKAAATAALVTSGRNGIRRKSTSSVSGRLARSSTSPGALNLIGRGCGNSAA